MPRLLASLILVVALALIAVAPGTARAQCYGYPCNIYPPVTDGSPYYQPPPPLPYGPPAYGYAVPTYPYPVIPNYPPYFPPSGFYFGSGWDPDYRDMRYNRYFSRQQNQDPQVQGYTLPGGND